MPEAVAGLVTTMLLLIDTPPAAVLEPLPETTAAALRAAVATVSYAALTIGNLEPAADIAGDGRCENRRIMVGKNIV